jgi:hypothetical protein
MLSPLWTKKIGSLKDGFFHHIFFLEGDQKETKPALLSLLEEEFSLKPGNNPDFHVGEFLSFGIDESRFLKTMQMRKSFSEDAQKIFIISANSFTLEAQNALLKIFEEPAVDTVFFILISSAQFLLPTLLSRAVVISLYEHEEKFEKIKKFLKESYAKRLEIVAETAKDFPRTQIFFEELIRFYYQKGKSTGSTKQEIKVLELTSKYRIYSYARSPSLKMMLEHLALVCPTQ